MNIVFLIDDNYSEQLTVTLASLLKNDKHNNEFNIFVLDTGISEDNKAKICQLKDYKPFNIEFIKVDISEFSDLPTMSHFKKMNYARLIFPDLINCERVLYLDCDTLVLEDLTDFYETDFEDNYVCAVQDRLISTPYLIRQLKKLGLTNYFNAGVMLLNLDKMRKDNISKKALDFANEHPEQILFLEQCVLNHTFEEKVKFVDKRYNFQYRLNSVKRIKNPAIIHFVGWEKPFFGFAHPYENLYYKYLKLTPYRMSFFKFKQKMWEMFYPRFKKRVCVLLKCMI